MESKLFRIVAVASFGIAGLFASHAFATTTISLVGFDLYASDKTGATTNGGFRYTSNSSDSGASHETLTNISGTQSTGISFALASGDNTFTFTPNNAFGTGDFTGVVFFFNDTGTSFNPTTSVDSQYVAFVPAGSSTIAFPASGVQVENYIPGGGSVAYNGATSFSIDGQTVTVTALSVDTAPAGSFTLTLDDVPEPASLGILGLSGLGLLVRRRRA
jgi:hypothetical protein